MEKFPGAGEWVPSTGGMRKVIATLPECRGCDLYTDAEQVVPGEGPVRSRLLFVGEQPGDVEDKQGRVFVGPAGRLLDKALAEAGIDRSDIFLTNAVKHFRYERQGKRRIHKTPAASHINACRPWLTRELAIVKPELVVILGSIAARALLGPSFRVTHHRGETVHLPDGTPATATVHPSAVVRSDNFRTDFAAFVADLKVAAGALG